MKGPEVEPPHRHHPTGHRWLDLSLPIAALFVSSVSLVVAFIDGMHMQKMAEANAKLVEANSWPFLEYSTGDVDENKPQIELRIGNVGVGPAKVESVEVFYRGQPVRNHSDLLQICCGAAPDAQTSLFINQVGHRVLPARETDSFLTVARTEQNAEMWRRLDAERLNVSVRACYCSVFDECWTTTLAMRTITKQIPVKACPSPQLQYEG